MSAYLQVRKCNINYVAVEQQQKKNEKQKKNNEKFNFMSVALCLNGRIFVSPKDHIDALVKKICFFLLKIFKFLMEFCFYLDINQTPLPEQEGATDGIDMDLEALSTKEVAYHITLFDWDLFWAVHEYELLYHTFGRHHFGKVST